ncbi:MAG: sulfotransferase family protein, partial [bacterium]
LSERMQALSKAADLRVPRVARVEHLAIVCAMPRSGTTLFEMMLDRHPSIGGIGEFDGLTEIQHALGRTPGWPRNLRIVPESRLAAEQTRYLAGAGQICRPGALWTFDKSLLAWQILLEIAASLPGALMLDIARDPRDMAVSQFMSYLSPEAYAWTRNLDLIRAMIEFHSRFVPQAIEALGGEGGPLRFESMTYEDLVEDPAHYAGRCLAAMGLPMDDAVLAPERSSRGAATLSSQQVKRPINRSSIGRWRNYEWAFDATWAPLVAAHEARRER